MDEEGKRDITDRLKGVGYEAPSHEHKYMIRKVIESINDIDEIKYKRLADMCHVSEKTARRHVKAISENCKALPDGDNYISKFRMLIDGLMTKDQADDQKIIRRDCM